MAANSTHFPHGPFPLPDPRKMAAGEMPVEDYFRELNEALTANNKGNPVAHGRLIHILKAAWQLCPSLSDLIHRLTPAQVATLDLLKQEVNNSLFPQGQADLILSILQQFWGRKQMLLEIPPGSGEYYPEPAFSYTEAKRALINKLPANDRPTENQIVHSIIQGLQSQLRQAVNLIRPRPQTIDDVVRTILEQEKSISEPAPAINHATTSFNATTHVVPGLRVHPPMANPPLDLFGKLSVTSGSGHAINATVTTPTTTSPPQSQLMDQLNQSMQQTLQQHLSRFQDSISTTLATSMSRHPHYGPAQQEQQPRCRWCKRTNHKTSDCFFRPVEQGGRGRNGGRGNGFNRGNGNSFNGGRGHGNGRFNTYSNKWSFDALSDSDLQSIADRVSGASHPRMNRAVPGMPQVGHGRRHFRPLKVEVSLRLHPFDTTLLLLVVVLPPILLIIALLQPIIIVLILPTSGCPSLLPLAL